MVAQLPRSVETTDSMLLHSTCCLKPINAQAWQAFRQRVLAKDAGSQEEISLIIGPILQVPMHLTVREYPESVCGAARNGTNQARAGLEFWRGPL
jgi:hypothetical protein